jgi:hypothetical protein
MCDEIFGHDPHNCPCNLTTDLNIKKQNEQRKNMESNLLKNGWKHDAMTPRSTAYEKTIISGVIINALKGKNWHSIVGGNGICECGVIVGEDEAGKSQLCGDMLAKTINDTMKGYVLTIRDEALELEAETNTDTPPEFLPD